MEPAFVGLYKMSKWSGEKRKIIVKYDIGAGGSDKIGHVLQTRLAM